MDVIPFNLMYRIYSAKLDCNSGWGLYSWIKSSKLKNIHTPHIGVPEFYLTWVFKMPVNAVGFQPKPHIDRMFPLRITSETSQKCFKLLSKPQRKDLKTILNHINFNRWLWKLCSKQTNLFRSWLFYLVLDKLLTYLQMISPV